MFRALRRRRDQNGPRYNKKRVALCIINEAGKGSSHMSSDNKVAADVKTSKIIVIENVENDLSATVEYDIQFKILRAKVEFQTKPTWKV